MIHDDQDTPLVNKNIRLRAVEPEDVELMFDVETDSSQWKVNGIMAPVSRHLLLQYALSYSAAPDKEGQLRLIIETKSTDRSFPIGVADVFEIDALNGNASVAIYILPKYRNCGSGTESVEILSCYCRDILNLNVITARISSCNPASIRMFEKASFVTAGSIPRWFREGDTTHSLMIMYRIL